MFINLWHSMYLIVSVLALIASVLNLPLAHCDTDNSDGPENIALARPRYAAPAYGSIELHTPFPNGEIIQLTVNQRNKPPFSAKIEARGNSLDWKSPPLPPGMYEVSYSLPASLPKIPSSRVLVHPGQKVQLSPLLTSQATLHVVSNIPESVFILRPQLKESAAWKGEGREYTFWNIPPGSYLLDFSTQQPDFFVPPDEMRLYLNDKEIKEAKVSFQVVGKLTINTNVPKSTVVIQEIGGQKKRYQDQILDQSKDFKLPEGKYIVTLSQEAKNVPAAQKLFPPEPVEIRLRPLATEVLNLNYRIEQAPIPEKQRQLIVTAQTTYLPIQATAFVPAGKAIIGDISSDQDPNTLPSKIVTLNSFSIGIYEVTNAQYATWLTKALKEGKIAYIEEADSQGQIIDMDGKLLFKTFEADPYSQISTQLNSLESPTFLPLPGKDSYPVINVSWYGAVAYCQDNHYRLPTEAEWEKAAGMAKEASGKPLQKFRFGFGRDQIDPTWANYKTSGRSIHYFQVLTTPVGFYNGVNFLPLSAEISKQQQTHLAKSPYGAFDMSGNVWEWVSDWYDESYYKNMSDLDPKGPATGTQKVVKGGCYDSLADGVRVSERLGLDPEHTDAYTGFRIARDAEGANN